MIYDQHVFDISKSQLTITQPPPANSFVVDGKVVRSLKFDTKDGKCLVTVEFGDVK